MGLFGSDDGDEVDEKAQSLVDDAKHDSVNIERLTKLKPGRMSRYLHDDPLIKYLNEDEQPHFILAARSKTPSVAGSTQQEAKRLQQEVPEQYGTGMVMHMITEGRWVMVASNSSEGDQMLEISFEELTDADYSTGNSSHSIDLRLDSASIDIPIANLYDEDDIEAAYSYIEDQLPESDEKGSVNSAETSANTEDDERELSDMELRQQRSKIAKNLGEVAVAEYKDGEYEIPEDYIAQETRFSSWSEFVSEIPLETEKNESDATTADTGSTSSEFSGLSNIEVSGIKNNNLPDTLAKIDDSIKSDETVHYAYTINAAERGDDHMGGITTGGCLLATDRRLTAYVKETIGSSNLSIDYTKIDTVEIEHGAMITKLSVQSTSKTYSFPGFNSIDRSEIHDFADFIRNQASESNNDDGSNSTGDPTEQLKNIKELHEQDVLTDEEFEEKKSDLLDKI